MRTTAWVTLLLLTSVALDFDKKYTGQVIDKSDGGSYIIVVLVIFGLIACIAQDLKELLKK